MAKKLPTKSELTAELEVICYAMCDGGFKCDIGNFKNELWIWIFHPDGRTYHGKKFRYRPDVAAPENAQEDRKQMNKKIPTKSERKKKLQETCEIMRGEGFICDIGCNATEIWLRVSGDGCNIYGRRFAYRLDVVAPDKGEIVLTNDSGSVFPSLSDGDFNISGSLRVIDINRIRGASSWFHPATQTGSEGWGDWVPERFIK